MNWSWTRYGLYIPVLLSVLPFFNGDVNPVLYMAYVYAVITLILLLVFVIRNLIKSPGYLKELGVFVGSVGFVLFISYLFTSDELNPIYGNISKSISRKTDVLLITLYVFICLTGLTALYSYIHRFFK